MSHFYGTLNGSRGEATRAGTKNSGLVAVAAGWQGAIRVEVYREGEQDRFSITLVPWQGSGGMERLIAHGELNAKGNE